MKIGTFRKKAGKGDEGESGIFRMTTVMLTSIQYVGESRHLFGLFELMRPPLIALTRMRVTLSERRFCVVETPSGTFVCCRILWFAIVVISTSIYIVQCSYFVRQYLSWPVRMKTSISRQGPVVFPAVTICNQNAFRYRVSLLTRCHSLTTYIDVFIVIIIK